MEGRLACGARLLAWLVLGGAAFPTAAGPVTSYRYIEAEQYTEATGRAYRDEGFTSWMGHPSGGRTVIFDNTPGAHLTLGPVDLPDEPLYLFVRQLAFPAPQASVEALVGQASVGVTEFAQPGTLLGWSKRIGPFRLGPGRQVTLRPAIGSTQAPYLDVILLTNDPAFVPDNADQDYRSSDVRVGGESITIDPMQVQAIEGRAGVTLRVDNANSRSWRLAATVAIRTTNARAEQVRSTELTVPAGVSSQRIPLGPCALGPARVRLEIRGEAGALLALQSQSVTVVRPVEVSLNSVSVCRTETLRADVTINDPGLLGKAPVGVMAIGRAGSRPIVVRARPRGSHICLAMPANRIAPGAYTLTVSVPGVPAAGRSYRITRLDPPADRLADIRKVEVRGQALFVNGRPFVPRKLYHAQGTSDVKSHGYNTVDCWGGDTLEGVEKMLDEAHANNLYGYGILFHPYFYKGFDKGFDLAAVERGVKRLRSHPALLLWELYDEPDAGVPIPQLQAAYDLVHRLDPNHPVLLNFCFPEKFAAYSVPCDIVSNDTYPVPSLPLTRVPDCLRLLDQAVNRAKPIQVALQTYGDARGRMPTPVELRCMTYLSIAAGARSFAYYSYSEGKGYPYCLEADPILWSYTREMNSELLALREYIAAPDAGAPKCSDPAISVVARRVGKGLVVIAANSLPRATSASISVQATTTGGATVLFEDRRIELGRSGGKAATLKDKFGPYEVHVYRMGL